jgi:hypothetical protein
VRAGRWPRPPGLSLSSFMDGAAACVRLRCAPELSLLVPLLGLAGEALDLLAGVELSLADARAALADGALPAGAVVEVLLPEGPGRALLGADGVDPLPARPRCHRSASNGGRQPELGRQERSQRSGGVRTGRHVRLAPVRDGFPAACCNSCLLPGRCLDNLSLIRDFQLRRGSKCMARCGFRRSQSPEPFPVDWF